VSDSLSRISELIQQGQRFTFQNFASKSSRGYPNAYSDDWLVWCHYLHEVVRELGQSPAANSIAKGLHIDLLGNDEDEFAAARQQIVSGLKAAQRITFGEVPASDRIVAIDHNSPVQAEVEQKIEELIEAVRRDNDFPGAPEEKEQVIAELSAGRKLLEAAQARLSSIRATLEPSLRWIMEKGAGTIVGKIAGGLWDLLVAIKWF
jgi:hypothetical protein